MNEAMIAVLNGAAQALVVGVLLRIAGGRYRMTLHAGVLLLAALLYVAFAVRGGSWIGVGIELVGLGLFGGVAVLGLIRRAPGILAFGWALHPIWDAALHTAGALEGYTPNGYVAACFGFDIVLAALIARGWAGAPTRSKAAAGAGEPLHVAASFKSYSRSVQGERRTGS
jgi:hypothetical protein